MEHLENDVKIHQVRIARSDRWTMDMSNALLDAQRSPRAGHAETSRIALDATPIG